MLRRFIWLIFLFSVFQSCTSLPDLPPAVQQAYSSLPEKMDYNQDVKPILSDRCFACHGPDKGKLEAGLRLDVAEMAYGELPETPGKYAIVPGKVNRSEVFHRIISNDPEYLMPSPRSHLTLSAKEKAVIIKWIAQGAEYKQHWAFIKPEKAKAPVVKHPQLVINPIDNFILRRLERDSLVLSPQAGKEMLLRRLSLDVTGLPPSVNDLNNFINDNSANAYEKQVNRLLASPRYGEKMAVDWLDVARFADSHGYTVDRIRDMSPWRDWVINAFNKNLHYDDFIKWQLAGDLLPNPTNEQLIATAFNRNHQQNMEGGIIEEEFRVEYVSDRTNTTGEAFMGLTVGCAKCHDHKFDPISQKEYYSLTGYFNNVKEAGQISWDNSMPPPTLMLPDKQKQDLIDFIKTTGQQQQTELQSLLVKENKEFEQWAADEGYKILRKVSLPQGLIAAYSLDKNIKNKIGGAEAEMLSEGGIKEKPVYVQDGKTWAMQFEGDSWMNTKTVGRFGRYDPFAVSVWVNIPKDLTEGVIFHQGSSGLLYNFRGFHLNIKDNKLELVMAHAAPYNAIIKYSAADIPRNQWIELTVNYDGLGKAAGYNIFLNSKKVAMVTDQDNLYKDILFTRYSGIDLGGNFIQPALQFGAWARGKGLAKGMMKDIKVFDRCLTALEINQLYDPQAFLNIAGKPHQQLSAADKNYLREYYLAVVSAEYRKQTAEITSLKKKYSGAIDSIPELMIMQEMPTPRKAYVLDRGQYDEHREEVAPGIIKALLPMPRDYPRNRLGLSMWLLHPDHPLTARVAVNRYWQMLFGNGLVRSSQDFGNQGNMPSHPELLDWLAVTFRESGWDVKALMKLMLMSATYRQQSVVAPKLLAIDPENILLGRGPSQRLTAEMLRDQALFASGLLNDTIGGPSVYPYQPKGLWQINNATYVQDSGSNVYRRSLYTVWKRSVPNPTLATFDVGIRTSCIVNRQHTNTPLQSLIVLNDPTFVEASKVMGEQMAVNTDQKQAIILAFVKLTGRKPTDKELSILLQLQQTELKKFTENPAKAKGWLSAGLYKVDQKISQPLIAANAVVASTIMNADAAITKR